MRSIPAMDRGASPTRAKPVQSFKSHGLMDQTNHPPLQAHTTLPIIWQTSPGLDHHQVYEKKQQHSRERLFGLIKPRRHATRRRDANDLGITSYNLSGDVGAAHEEVCPHAHCHGVQFETGVT